MTLYLSADRPAEKTITRVEFKEKKEKKKAGGDKVGETQEVRESFLLRVIHPEIRLYQHEPNYLLCNSTNLLCSDIL